MSSFKILLATSTLFTKGKLFHRLNMRKRISETFNVNQLFLWLGCVIIFHIKTHLLVMWFWAIYSFTVWWGISSLNFNNRLIIFLIIIWVWWIKWVALIWTYSLQKWRNGFISIFSIIRRWLCTIIATPYINSSWITTSILTVMHKVFNRWLKGI